MMSLLSKTTYQEILRELKEQTKLVAVTKKVSLLEIKDLYELGQRDFGENRVQELKEKAHALGDLKDIRWHFIGHLQRKKVKELLTVPRLKYIHSVDSLELLAELAKRGNDATLFLQVNTSGESEKSGFDDFSKLKEALAQSPHIKGLMTMATFRTKDKEKSARECFVKLKAWRDQLEPKLLLSMGMSGDYPIALECESDWVRIGSKLFTNDVKNHKKTCL